MFSRRPAILPKSLTKFKALSTKICTKKIRVVCKLWQFEFITKQIDAFDSRVVT